MRRPLELEGHEPDLLTVLEEIFGGRHRFASRPDIGDTEGILNRLSRRYMGSPIRDFISTSANFSSVVGLGDEPRAQAVVMTLTQSPCNYTAAGAAPNSASGQPLAIGTTVILTGQESLRGFLFVSQLTGPAVFVGTFYD
jgi:hypothetical protein